ncbi:coniferyl aldehyde dehydrogenase [Acetobacteraceae bacterium KSS8]|uniref:Aldehyde dehydrogenase n=1 Tax=Endosaccharibacter trunci TaxID=2812733 RepID=A0ABT1W677_9PROT|nr:coniferyl aldehyde dehydrogenase [Acetobacteraceae bacterium KSS8]
MPDAALDLRATLDAQRAAAAKAGEPSLAERRAHLSALDAVLSDAADRFHAAISADFGHRAYPETVLAELVPLRAAIRFAHTHLRSWMRPRRAPVGVTFQPGRAWVEKRPLGCVGIVSPWNYPLFLSVGPLVDALAAGNRAMLKPSEATPRFAALLRRELARAFPADRVAVVDGDAAVAQSFTALPFDHLLFTGSTRVGTAVMHAAADGLVPVTLELGGKSPAIVAPDAPLDRTARTLMVGKLFNAGQTCIAPDYVLVPEDRVEAFAAACVESAAALYPHIANNDDYSTIISTRHLDRLQAVVEEAKGAGARVLRDVSHAAEAGDAERSKRMVPTLLLDTPDSVAAMREEIFGPVLPIVGYRSLPDAIRYVNARPRPLALYAFTDDAATERHILSRTLSGGATINGTLLHCAQTALPFGGIGPSGTGTYHGKAGFDRFSHDRGVYRQGRFSGFTVMAPPHGTLTRLILPLMLGRSDGGKPH